MIYLMVFDRNPSFDYQPIHNFINNNPQITDWSHYMLSAYILVSPLSANDLANQIIANFCRHRFLLIEINNKNYQGWLTQDAWTWLKKYL